MNTNEIKVLIFKINDESYAADIMDVERILGYEETTKIPEAPEFVDGVRNYEGKILPVINLCIKFGIPFEEIKDDAKVIVTKSKNNKIGMLVDSVSEVRDVDSENIEVPPEIVAGISKRYVKGLIKIEDEIIIFLNLNAILTEEEQKLLQEA